MASLSYMRMPDPTVPFSIRLTPEQFIALEEKARAAGLNRSDYVRRIITAPSMVPEALGAR